MKPSPRRSTPFSSSSSSSSKYSCCWTTAAPRLPSISRSVTSAGVVPILVVLLLLVIDRDVVECRPPQFDSSGRGYKRTILLPASVPVLQPDGTPIFRLLVYDYDQATPLRFSLRGAGAVNAFRIRGLPCDEGSTICYAEIFLIKAVEAGRMYDTILEVTNKNGESRSVDCRIDVTNSTTANVFAFPSYSSSPIVVPESAQQDATLFTLRVNRDKSQNRMPNCELRGGGPTFKIDRAPLAEQNIDVTLKLNGPLDYERENLYHLFLVCEYAMVQSDFDSRNLVATEILVRVGGEQDTAPVFTYAPPLTRIPGSAKPGDELLRLKAKDGDLGSEPREIRYSLWRSVENPWLQYFQIDEKTGAISMKSKLDDLLEAVDDECVVMLTLEAEELVTSETDFTSANQATRVTIGFVLDDARTRNPPTFSTESIFASVKEHSAGGTEVVYSGSNTRPQVINPNADGRSVVQIQITEDDGLFEVSPTVVTQGVQDIQIRVKDSLVLDYEKMKEVHFKLLAYRVGTGLSTTATTEVTIKIEDVNDNPPVFSQRRYFAQVPEDAKTGTVVIQFNATDADSPDGPYGQILFTRLDGPNLDKFILEQSTGILKIARNPMFDRETTPEYTYTIEARDDHGDGNLATAELVLQVTDVNDNPPRFNQRMYAGVLNPGMQTFQTKITVKAEDVDEGKNGEILYAIEKGNDNNLFMINSRTGEINVRSESPVFDQLTVYKSPDDTARRNRGAEENYVIVLIVKAYDKGNPSLFSTVPVEIYTQETVERTLRFVLPHSVAQIRGNQSAFESMLKAISGGRRVDILDVDPYDGDADASLNNIPVGGRGKSIVTANVLLPVDALVDVAQIVSSVSTNDNDPEVKELRAANTDLLAVIIALTIILLFILILLIMWFLYRRRKTKETEKAMLLKDEESQNGSITLRQRLARVFSPTTYQRPIGIDSPGRGRIGVWTPEGHAAIRDSPHGRGRDLDQRVPPPRERRYNRTERPVALVQAGRELREAGGGAAGRRFFVVRDAQGALRGPETLREGESYVLEDIEDETGTETLRRYEFERGSHVNVYEDDHYRQHHEAFFIDPESGRRHRFSQIGNSQILTLVTPKKGRKESDGYHADGEGYHSLPYDDHPEYADDRDGRDGRRSRTRSENQLIVPLEDYQRSRGAAGHDEKVGKEMIMNRFMEQQNRDHYEVQHHQNDEDTWEELPNGAKVRRKRKIHTPIAEETMSALEFEMKDGRLTKDGRRISKDSVMHSSMQAVEEEEVESRIESDAALNPPGSPFVGYVHNKASKLRHINVMNKLEDDDHHFEHTHLTRKNSNASILNNTNTSNMLNESLNMRSRRNSIAAIEGIARRRSSASARAEQRRNSTVGFENVKFGGPLDRLQFGDRSRAQSVEPDERSHKSYEKERKRHHSDPKDSHLAKDDVYSQEQPKRNDSRIQRGQGATNSASPRPHNHPHRHDLHQTGSDPETMPKRDRYQQGFDSDSPAGSARERRRQRQRTEAGGSARERLAASYNDQKYADEREGARRRKRSQTEVVDDHDHHRQMVSRKKSKEAEYIEDSSEAKRRRASLAARRLGGRMTEASSMLDITGEAEDREMRRRREGAISRDGRKESLFAEEIQRESDLERSMRSGDIIGLAATRKARLGSRDRTRSDFETSNQRYTNSANDSISDDAKIMQQQPAGGGKPARRGSIAPDAAMDSSTYYRPTFDEDLDSGISSNAAGPGRVRKKSQQMLEKKSVFTIKFDDVQNRHFTDLKGPPTS